MKRLARIILPSRASRAAIEGYTELCGTRCQGCCRDVFAVGDAWFRSGDLMRKDARGFFYFVDRGR